MKLGVGQGRHGHTVSSWTQFSHLACSGMASVDDHGQGREIGVEQWMVHAKGQGLGRDGRQDIG